MKPPKQLKIRSRLAQLFKDLKSKRDKDTSPGYTFHLTKHQSKVASRWAGLHMVSQCPLGDKNAYAGAVSGRMSYVFHSTSIGEMKLIRCSCGASLFLNGDEL